jgi:hypothetical protein
MSHLRRILSLIHSGRPAASGQVLPLFALFLIVLFGMAALAIDISRAYSDLRFYRSSSDAASLAGAQDLQFAGSRTVTPADQQRARGHALESLELRLNGTATGCGPTSADIIDCPISGTGFLVNVKTPSPSCSSCDPQRSVQVTVRNPNYGLTFARLFGSNQWNIGTTSISGLVFGKSYTIITLRPPKELGSTFTVNDITINGGSVVNVNNGDVGSNSNMNYSGSGSILTLDSGYNMYYFPAPPPDDDPGWFPSPPGTPNSRLITDPNYRYPLMSGSLGTAPTYTDARSSMAGPLPLPVQNGTDPTCAAEIAKVDPARYTFMATTPPTDVYCYNPGIYDTTGARQIKVASSHVALLKPGAYYLKGGLDVSGRLIGGYEPGAPGVALMFDECRNTCTFAGNNFPTVALNAGTKFPASYTGGAAATAARDWDNQLVQTSGPDSPTPPLPLTILVKKDTDGPGGTQGCYVPTSAPFVEPAACNASNNQTINIFGNGDIVLEGVQYAPTDNIAIGGNSGSTGRVGQIISWTLKYAGGIGINQEGPGSLGNGILRIDAACSAPGEPCNP